MQENESLTKKQYGKRLWYILSVWVVAFCLTTFKSNSTLNGTLTQNRHSPTGIAAAGSGVSTLQSPWDPPPTSGCIIDAVPLEARSKTNDFSVCLVRSLLLWHQCDLTSAHVLTGMLTHVFVSPLTHTLFVRHRPMYALPVHPVVCLKPVKTGWSPEL